MALASRPSTVAAAHTPTLLILEFWGLGDLVFSTSIFRAALARYDVTLVGKPHAVPLLQPTFPELRFLAYDPPWSAHRNKYQLSRWNWPDLGSLLRKVRITRFDAAISVRADPRDHLLMALSGARRRCGFPARGSNIFLTERVRRSSAKQHRVQDWRDIGRTLGLDGVDGAEPWLNSPAYRSSKMDALLERAEHSEKPVLCLHAGARIWTRRWPEQSFAAIVRNLRDRYDFHLVLVPDPDGYGTTLAPLADSMATGLSVPEMVDLLGRVDLLFCNDSGPAHIAAACGKPVIPVFGPTDPDGFHPWQNEGHLVIRDICPWRPCFDYCHFNEPHCLTKLSPELVWPEIRSHIDSLIARGILPLTLSKFSAPPRPLA